MKMFKNNLKNNKNADFKKTYIMENTKYRPLLNWHLNDLWSSPKEDKIVIG